MVRPTREQFAIYLILPVIALLAGADAPPKGYVATRAASAIEVDGKLDDPAWADAPWTEDFGDIEGDGKPRPRFRTRAKMMWDDRCFYVAAEMEEPHVWGKLTQHDAAIYQDNAFEVFIDPDGDHHDYFELQINALDAVWDLFLNRPYRDGGQADSGWEVPGLKAITRVDGTLNDPMSEDRGWTVEMAIPWASMADRAHVPTPPRDGDQWRVNLSRVEWQHRVVDHDYEKVPGRKADFWTWSPHGTINMHRPERLGFVQFSTEKPGAAAFRPDPSLPARDLLMRIYEAQKAYQAKNRSWAPSLDALGLAGLRTPDGKGAPTLHLDEQGYEAAIPGTDGAGRSVVWTVRQDSRIGRRGDAR